VGTTSSCGSRADASDPDEDRQRLPQDGVTSSVRTGNSDASAVDDPMIEGQQAIIAGLMLAAAACALSVPLQFQPPSGHNEVIADQLDPGTDQPAPVDHAVTADDQPTAIGQSPPVEGDLSAPTDNAVNVDEPPTTSDHPSPVDAAQSAPGPDAHPSTSMDAHVDTANEAEMTDLHKVHASRGAPRRTWTRSLDKSANNGDG
jgi:hypothetical protein